MPTRAQTGSAQLSSERPLRLVVGQSPGTSTDIVCRIVGGKWSEALRQSVVVDNRPGAGETIAAGIVANASPDGHTALFGSIASHGIAPAIYRKLPYHPGRDFAPLSLVGTTPNVLVVYPGLPATNVRELAVYIRSNPGKLNYASTGVGTSTHLSMELLKAKLGLDIVHVPYKAGPAAFADLMAGQVAAALFNLPSQLGSIKSGKLRALGVSSRERAAQLPDVPTIREAGVAGFEIVVWYAMFAPAGIPKAVHARLREALREVLHSRQTLDQLAVQGVDARPSTPDELARHSRAEVEKWSRVAQQAGIKVD